MIYFFDHLSFFLACMFFSDCFYISFVEHPARMECPLNVSLKQWRQSYPKALRLQILVLLFGTLFSILTYMSNGNLMWFLAGTLLFLSFPYTIICLLPTNNLLYKTEDEKTVKMLLEKWGKGHFLRTVLSFISTMVMMFLLCK